MIECETCQPWGGGVIQRTIGVDHSGKCPKCQRQILLPKEKTVTFNRVKYTIPEHLEHLFSYQEDDMPKQELNYIKYDYDKLYKMTIAELKTTRDNKRNELGSLQQRRFTMMGQILFYQAEIEKERGLKL